MLPDSGPGSLWWSDLNKYYYDGLKIAFRACIHDPYKSDDLILLFLLIWRCNSIETPETLARKHCSACHVYPEPALLDKRTWQKEVFPEMAFRMGMDISKVPGTNANELREILQTIPAGPLLSEKEWRSIQAHYLESAPDSLQLPPHGGYPLLHQFSATALTLPISGKTALTMIRSDVRKQKIYVGTRERKLYVFNPAFTPEDSFKTDGPTSDMLFPEEAEPIILSMGLMDPNDQSKGAVFYLPETGKEPILMIDSLKRPVDIQRANLDQDENEDLLISAFGNFTGGLFVYEKNSHHYRQHTIHNFPGTRKTILHDFNADGLPDILALITQGDEQIALFTNRGKFRFSYQVLLKFPPVYGSSYFELGDFNADGHQDILYTNGDNADYSEILKPYHGLRIFLNDGKNHFKESWFHPMHGASMTATEDFDKDGDLDIAAISFFPDFGKHPEHAFMYFEKDGGKFTAFHTPLAAASRWITIESADIDADGDTDLILGALAFPAAVPEDLFKSWGEKEVSLLVLKNKVR
jgi:hypothetical protein